MSQHPIDNLKIDGFRGLRALEINGLGLVNVFIGGNNSGKTSILEAVAILANPTNPEEWLAMVRRRDFGGLDETRVQSLRWCFPRNASETPQDLFNGSCRFQIEGKFPLAELTAIYNEFIGEPSPEELKRSRPTYRIREDDIEEAMHGCEIMHSLKWIYDNDLSVKDIPHPAPSESRLLRVWDRLVARSYSGARGARLKCETLTPYSYQMNRIQVRTQSSRVLFNDKERALDLLRNFDHDIEGVELASFVGDRPAIYIRHKKLGLAPLSIFGDAMRRCVLLAATLPALADGGILLIDEVEVGIHAGLLSHVFEWLLKSARDLGVQIFVTTHSLEALDAIIAASQSAGDTDIAAFHIDAEETMTTCRRFSGDMLHRLRFERGLDLR